LPHRQTSLRTVDSFRPLAYFDGGTNLVSGEAVGAAAGVAKSKKEWTKMIATSKKDSEDHRAK